MYCHGVPVLFHANFFHNRSLIYLVNLCSLNLTIMNKGYVEFITDLKQRIVQSRYTAARLANREQLMLYLKTGWALSQKIVKEKWGNSVIDRIAEDLQKQLPGLRGFSARNLRQMKRFYAEYQSVIFWQSPTAKFEKPKNGKKARNERSLILQLTNGTIAEQFWRISFHAPYASV